MSEPYPRVSTQPKELPKTRYATESLWLIALIIVVGNFAGTLAAPDQLCKIPFQNLLKNTLHVSREETARFFFLAGLFFYLKPLAGILTDAFPLFRTRRRYYLLLSSLFGALGWLALLLVPRTYSALLTGVIALNLCIVMISTVTGAFLVEVGQSRGEVGKLTAIRQAARSALFTIQGPLGGLLAGMAFWVSTGTGAFITLSIFPIAYFYLKEKPTAKRNPAVFQNAGRQLGVLARSWPFWAATLFIGLYNFAPGLATMGYFRQNDVLHLNQHTIGLLGADANIAGLLAAFVYYRFARRVTMRTTLIVSVSLAALSQLLYVFYNTQALAFAIDFQGGLFGGYVAAALLDLAARSTPAGCEGLGYAFIMSINNVSTMGSDWLGSSIADKFHVSWNNMVILNAATTALVLVLLPFMPKQTLQSKDNQTPNLENTGEPEAA